MKSKKKYYKMINCKVTKKIKKKFTKIHFNLILSIKELQFFFNLFFKCLINFVHNKVK